MGSTPPKSPERRRHPRAITSFSAVVTAGGRQYTARVINLSMGGALLDFGDVAPEPAVKVCDRVSLEIRRRGTARPLPLEGKAVLWNLKAGDHPLLAVQFEEMSDESADLLEDLLAEALVEIGGRIAAFPAPKRRVPSS